MSDNTAPEIQGDKNELNRRISVAWIALEDAIDGLDERQLSDVRDANGWRVLGVPNSDVFWAIVALVLVYSAYVAEVYRAGIASIHPSQVASARALGLSRRKSLRFVVLPQAVRRVIPPLLNDFIGLQKDTALVQVIGVVDGFNQSRMIASNAFNLSAVTIVAILFVLITIPQARFVDRLVERDQARMRAAS